MTCAHCGIEIANDQPYFELVLFDRGHEQVGQRLMLGSTQCLLAFVTLQSIAADILMDYMEEHKN
jgi:hypothetical protein